MSAIYAIILAAFSFTASADLPFRIHRYSSLDALPPREGLTVFLGNSITNMHEWFEAFGSDDSIVNRGVSGAFTDELAAHLESVVDTRPEKIFLLIGTNDLSTTDNTGLVLARLKAIVTRIRRELPETKLYVQSILPRKAEDVYSRIRIVNKGLKEFCDKDPEVTFVDLDEPLQGLRQEGDLTADGLHLYGSGYRIWCRIIAPMVGRECVYTDSMKNLSSGFKRSFAMRSSYFGMLPVEDSDVLIIGDEMVNSGEWHELLGTSKIKNRGTDWAYGGLYPEEHIAQLETILTGNDNKKSPAKILFYCATLKRDSAEYASILDRARELAPTSKLYVMSQLPVFGNEENSEITVFNEALRKLAVAKGATYIDIASSLALPDGSPNPECISKDDYVMGRGYIRIAQALAPFLKEEGAKVVTEQEYDIMRERRNARKMLGDMVQEVLVAHYDPAVAMPLTPALQSALEEAYAVLGDEEFNAVAANAVATRLSVELGKLR